LPLHEVAAVVGHENEFRACELCHYATFAFLALALTCFFGFSTAASRLALSAARMSVEGAASAASVAGEKDSPFFFASISSLT
jgi:hypothetical protein